MHASNDDHGKPVLDAEKAPYGHADAPALAAGFPKIETPAVLGLNDEQIQSNAETLHSFAEEGAPLFPPLNVGMANADEPQALPISTTEQDAQAANQAQPLQHPQGAESFRSFVKAQPLASMLAAAVFGALLVGVLLPRGSARG